MKLGIIGLPESGKTTIFTGLTGGHIAASQNLGGRFEVMTTVVDVPDERVDALSHIFKPRKTTYAKVTYSDIAGLQKGVGESGGMSGQLLNHLAGLDGFVHVVRAFTDDNVPHPEGSVDPARDLATLDTEFLLNDMLVVERRLEKLQEMLRKGGIPNKAASEKELALFEHLQAALIEERPLRNLGLDDETVKALRGYSLLTLKPVLVVINISDDQDEVVLAYDHKQSVVVNLRGKLEMELAQLSGDDLALFMAEYGVSELSLGRLIRLSYDLMGLQSFFTVGEDEVRAWTLKRGATAVDAAAAVHTDLAKGFIRAETIQWEELVELGGLAQARAVGKLRQEGKSYRVHDGDVITVKFNL
jgi:ribosome-binding ATPase